MAKAQETHESKLKMAQLCNCIGTNYSYKAKMIKSILDRKDNVNQVIPASVFQYPSQSNLTECTILHIAAIKRDVEAFKILLDNGADFTMQNQQGSTVLHYLFDCEPDDSRNELINAVLSAHVKFANSSNPCNSYGIHFHIACLVNNTQAVQFFLANAVSTHQVVQADSPMFSGFSSLHFAAEGCSIETMKLLLQNDANISLKDAQGRTALHVFLQKKINLFDSLRDSEIDATKVILEKIVLMDDNINLLLQNDDIDDVGFSQFHSACTMRDSSVAEYLVECVSDIHHHIKFDSPVWPGYTALHFAAHCNMKIFQMLVQKGASIEMKNAKGFTPLDIVCEKCKPQDLLKILRCKSEWVDSKFINGKTKLIKLIDAMRTEPLQFCSYLQVAVDDINIQVFENPPFWVGFMPLHFAVLVSKDTNLEMVQLCLNHGADITIQDFHGRTPVHLAFHINKIEVTILLLNSSSSSSQNWSLSDNEGLSLDHIFQHLMRHSLAYKLKRSLGGWINGRDIFQDVKASWLHLAVYSGDCDCDALNLRLNSDSLIPNNVDAIITCYHPSIFWTRYRGYTPLHLAIERLSSAEIVEALLMNGADIFAKRPDGMTPIYSVLKDVSYDYLIRQFILQLEANYDFSRPERIPKQYLTQLSGITMLHVACRIFDVEAAKNLIEDGIDVDARVHSDCPIWSKCTALHVLLSYSVRIQEQYLYEDFQKILGLLLAKGADVTAFNGDGDTPVHLSFEHCMNRINDYNFVCVSLLMDYHKDFTINPVNAKKISHFHAACIVNNVEAVEKFLNNGVDVNEPINLFVKNFAGESSLHLALKRMLGNDNHMRTVDLLLSHGANILAEDSYGYTALHRAAYDYSANVKLFEKLVTYGADVNAKSIFGETPMEFLLKVDQISLDAVNVLLDAGCQLNSCNHITEEGYLAIIVDNVYHKAPQTRVFRRMMEALDLSKADEMNRTALHNIVATRKANFNIINYADIIGQFEKLGINLDHQDRLGKTALHLAAKFRNTEATAALINAGVDVNIIDSSDKTALSYALESCKPPDNHDGNVVKKLVEHLRKLQLFGICINQLNEYLLKENNFNISFDQDRLLSERKRIKGKVVDTEPRLILDDFLLETKALTSYPFMIDSKRKKVKDSLKFITDKSVEFKSILLFQYRKILKGVVV